MKINTHPTVPPLQPIPTQSGALPFQTVTMDFITALPPSGSFDALFVVVDHDVTKATVLMPCTKTIDALGTALLYHEHVFRRFGLPKILISDRGPQFASKVFQELCSRLAIKSKMSTAFHPQTDGATERVNRSVVQMIRSVIRPDQKDWKQALPMVEFAINSSISAATGLAPFEANGGYMPSMMAQIAPMGTAPPGVRAFVIQALTNLAITHDALIASRVLQRHHANKHRREDPEIREGDLVYLSTKNLSLPKG